MSISTKYLAAGAAAAVAVGTAILVAPSDVRAHDAVPPPARSVAIAHVEESRDITVDGTTNVRDVGGYAGAGGKHVRWRTVLRGAALNAVTQQGVQQLAALNLKEVVDIRDTSEVDENGPDIVPSGVTVVSEPIAKPDFSGPPTDDQIIAAYRAYVSDADRRAHFGATLRRIADGGQRPILIQCDTGENRTGWEMAILLTALGVARSDVEQDYLLSNDHIPGNYAKAEFLDAAFDEADKEYGSFDGFLHNGLGVDQATVDRLRADLLS